MIEADMHFADEEVIVQDDQENAIATQSAEVVVEEAEVVSP